MAKSPKKISARATTLITTTLQCTAYNTEDDLPDTSNCIIGMLRCGDNSTDPDGVSEFIIQDGDGDDGHYVWWSGVSLTSGWVDVDFDILVGAEIEWEVDGTTVSDDSLSFGNINAVAISASANAEGVSIAWNGINISFYDSNGVAHDAPGVPSTFWPEDGTGSNEGAVYVTPGDTSNPIVHAHITGSVQLTRPNTNPLGTQAIVAKIFIYAPALTAKRAAVHPRRRLQK